METGSAVDAVAVEKRHGSGTVLCADLDQFLGQGGAFEEGECGARVKFDIAGHRTTQS